MTLGENLERYAKELRCVALRPHLRFTIPDPLNDNTAPQEARTGRRLEPLPLPAARTDFRSFHATGDKS